MVENDIDGKKTSHVIVKDEISYAFMCMITLAHFRTARNKLSWLPQLIMMACEAILRLVIFSSASLRLILGKSWSAARLFISQGIKPCKKITECLHHCSWHSLQCGLLANPPKDIPLLSMTPDLLPQFPPEHLPQHLNPQFLQLNLLIASVNTKLLISLFVKTFTMYEGCYICAS